MQITLLGQGFEPKSVDSVGNHLIRLLSKKEFTSVTFLSAFASKSGINGLAKYIASAKKHLKNITFIVGVDQKGTSKEALESIVKLDINSYIFYQPSFAIFHPKLYLFEGKEQSELVIGSSNLTSQGLFSNVETSLLINTDNSEEADRKIIAELKDYFKGIFDLTDPNLKRITGKLIADLIKAGIVPTEAERKAMQDKGEKISNRATANVLAKIFPRRLIAKIPNEFRGTGGAKSTKKTENAGKSVQSNSSSIPVWQSGPLTERDLNIPKGTNTNQTGSMLIKKGKLVGIDQRHYFRDTVFSSLTWKRDANSRTAHIERAIASFRIIVMRKDCGEFKLALSHNTRTDTRSYEQKNSMTSISWGPAKKFIAKEVLIGKSANLYETKKGSYTLTIE